MMQWDWDVIFQERISNSSYSHETGTRSVTELSIRGATETRCVRD